MPSFQRVLFFSHRKYHAIFMLPRSHDAFSRFSDVHNFKRTTMQQLYNQILLFLLLLITFSDCQLNEFQQEANHSNFENNAFLSDNQTQHHHHHHHNSSDSWNFDEWWKARETPDTPETEEDQTKLYSDVVFDEPPKIYADFDRFGHVAYRPYPPFSATGVSIATEFDVEHFYTPTTSIEVLNSTIRQFFLNSRHSSDDKEYMRDLRESLKERFLSYGLKTAFHIFKTEDSSKVVRTNIFIYLSFIFFF